MLHFRQTVMRGSGRTHSHPTITIGQKSINMFVFILHSPPNENKVEPLVNIGSPMVWGWI